MLALVVAMVICVTLGAGVVAFVMLEARREGRGEFWTAEGEELIAGVRRTSERVGEKVRERGSQLGSTAVERGQALRERLPERPTASQRTGQHTDGRPPATGTSPSERPRTRPTDGAGTGPSDEDLRAAS
ncbi:hypothetical protein [Ornithinimicrobium sufpigmenti]|uniref:hypothetical protein n=1 Tax=Ornithinimicrobium sufpigmenti TaxID=2508882 RepID=UPI0010355E5C|nr:MULTISPECIES: hypothetical protein [unclassified Ornithinimicrobium]